MPIDVHTHAFHPKVAQKVLARLKAHYGITPAGSGTVDDLLARARAAGLDRIVVHTAATDASQVKPANNWSLSLMRDHPEILAFGTMHPDHPDPAAEFARLQRNGVPGLKFHCDFQGFRMDDPALVEIMEMAGNGFVYMFHVGDRLPPHENPSCPAKLMDLAGRFPDAVIIAAHMGGYLHWECALEKLVGSDVYIDTSSTLRFIGQETLQTIWNRHPRERILFGSDYPLFDPGREIACLRSRLGLGDAELEGVLENAARLFAEA